MPIPRQTLAQNGYSPINLGQFHDEGHLKENHGFMDSLLRTGERSDRSDCTKCFFVGRATLDCYAQTTPIHYSERQKIPLRFSDIPQTFGNLWSKFYLTIKRSYLRLSTKFYSIICNFDEVVPY